MASNGPNRGHKGGCDWGEGEEVSSIETRVTLVLCLTESKCENRWLRLERPHCKGN
ncbi:hypothetical protein ACLKA6_002195 [Drosophila palustris]